MTYQLGIDLGTTYSAAAICRREGDGYRAETVRLGQRASAVPTVVYIDPDGAEVMGEAAQRRILTDPSCVAREFKRRIGDPTPLVIAGRSVAAPDLAARFVVWLMNQVVEREGEEPLAIAVTYPADWGSHKVEVYAAALEAAGMPPFELIPEPIAAATAYASRTRVEPGAVIGMYDLGGGTFDAAIVQCLSDTAFDFVGRPVGIENFGGVDLDEVLFRHVQESSTVDWSALDPEDPAALAAVAALRRECTEAKEALSSDTEVNVPVLLPNGADRVRMVRSEFEALIEPAIAGTVEAMREACVSANLDPSALTSIVLVGGSSRIPLVAQLLSAELGVPVTADSDPKHTVAQGAALFVSEPVESEPVPVVVPGTAEALAAETAVIEHVPARPVKALQGPGLRPEKQRRYRIAAMVGAVGIAAAAVLAVTAADLSGGTSPAKNDGDAVSTPVAAAQPATPVVAPPTSEAPAAASGSAGGTSAGRTTDAVRPTGTAPTSAKAPAPNSVAPPANTGGGTEGGGTEGGGTEGGGTEGGGTEGGGTEGGGTEGGGTEGGGTEGGGTEGGGSETTGGETGGVTP